MARLRSLQPHVASLSRTTLAAALPESSAYGQGRGGRPWRRLRERILQRDRYRCRECERIGMLTLADEVDHVVPLCQGGTDDEANLEAICLEHHKAKTARESHGG